MAGNAGDIRAEQRRLWEQYSPAWGKWCKVTLPMLSNICNQMIAALDIADETVHLDIAAGTGEPGLTIAERTAKGRAVLADFSPGMLSVARQRALAAGLTNVDFVECSAEDLPFDDESFDSLTCRMGIMFFADTDAAIGEMRRVLRPGGRLAVAVWAGPEQNYWAAMPMAAIARETATPARDPNEPGLFRFSGPGALTGLLRKAGFRDVHEVIVSGEMVSTSAEEFWTHMTEVAVPIVSSLSRLDPAARERIARDVIEQARRFETNGGHAMPYRARVCVATK